MESFVKIECLVECAVQEAECCLGQRGYNYVNNRNHGQVIDKDYIELLQINAYIRAMNRYLNEARCRCTPPRLINPSAPPCLNPQVNSVPLGIESVDCFHCLTEREVLTMIEVLKIFCSNCNCN